MVFVFMISDVHDFDICDYITLALSKSVLICFEKCLNLLFFLNFCLFAVRVQEIDNLLAGGLTDEDEDDVLKELEQIVKVRLICEHFKTKFKTRLFSSCFLYLTVR